MTFIEIAENKKRYLDLLLLADEQEDMLDRYLERGTMYVLDDCGVKCVCVVTDEGDGLLEIKNLATDPDYQRHGYGRKMIEWLSDRYRSDFRIMQVGTGESPLTLPFYEKCGFQFSHRIKDFFLVNYDHPIVEGGVRLIDMVYFRKLLHGDK
ncbi:MAG: GNAT family N-acetyltransferase [Eubacteriales bacterium]|nr:GNAT family N-acetyltransferase [Eubacteriales bacterium]